jgi:prepilin-type N-terminal cleavage/methylation domain-containing protein
MLQRNSEIRNNHAGVVPPCLEDEDRRLVFSASLYSRMCHHKGFALLELLVVISIIVMLLSIMIPALNNAREMAKSTVCKTHLYQINLASIVYAGDYYGRIVPGDLWNGTGIKGYVTKWTPDGIGNMGHLLKGKVLELPTSVDHPFYCPSDPTDRYKKVPTTMPRYFEELWSLPGTFVDFGYEFRDSYDGGALWRGTEAAYGFGVQMEKIGSHSILTDFSAWGYNVYRTHKRRYNVLLGDSSVQQIDDRSYKFPVTTGVRDPRQAGLSNWILYGNPVNFSTQFNVSMDYLLFDAVDYMLNKSYYIPPRVQGEQASWLPVWRVK